MEKIRFGKRSIGYCVSVQTSYAFTSNEKRLVFYYLEIDGGPSQRHLLRECIVLDLAKSLLELQR